MNYLFYLTLAIFVLSLGGAIFGIGEWLYHRRRHRSILLWSLGLLCQNWFQVPTLIALAGGGSSIVLTDFNFFFSLAFPGAFLGFEFVYLGSLIMLKKNQRWTLSLLTAWFALSILFYGFYYQGSLPFQTVWPIIGSDVLFFLPIFALNLSIAIMLFQQTKAGRTKRLAAGIISYAIAACFGIARAGVSLFFGLTRPPQFATLRFFSAPFIITQVAGLAFLILSFFFLHRSFEELDAPDPSLVQ